ncbi:hypothetical protein D3C71_1394610 [compost metagenome]
MRHRPSHSVPPPRETGPAWSRRLRTDAPTPGLSPPPGPPSTCLRSLASRTPASPAVAPGRGRILWVCLPCRSRCNELASSVARRPSAASKSRGSRPTAVTAACSAAAYRLFFVVRQTIEMKKHANDQRPQPAPGAIQRCRRSVQQPAGHRAMGGGRGLQGPADSRLGQALLRRRDGGGQPGLLR